MAVAEQNATSLHYVERSDRFGLRLLRREVAVAVGPGDDVGEVQRLDVLECLPDFQLLLVRPLVGRGRPVLDVGSVFAREEVFDVRVIVGPFDQIDLGF